MTTFAGLDLCELPETVCLKVRKLSFHLFLFVGLQLCAHERWCTLQQPQHSLVAQQPKGCWLYYQQGKGGLGLPYLGIVLYCRREAQVFLPKLNNLITIPDVTIFAPSVCTLKKKRKEKVFLLFFFSLFFSIFFSSFFQKQGYLLCVHVRQRGP